MNAIDFLPKWTKRATADSGGRDPLGLSRVAFTITDYLLTGIITTTDRARYYSFYTWVLWQIEQTEEAENYNQFVEAFRRKEAAMGLATLYSEPLLNPVGVLVLKNQLERGKQTGQYDCNFKVLPSNPLGGYGQYYGSSIYHLKLSYGDEQSIDRVNDAGKELALAFNETIEDTDYIKNKKFLQNTISESDLEELQNNFALDSIAGVAAANEREKLIDIFFSQSENYLDEKSQMRRQTLTILLDLISEFGKEGIKLNSQNNYLLDEFLLYAVYYDALWIDDETILPIEKLKNHNHCYELWKQFCLHQFLGQSLEYLLYAVLETAGSETLGLSLNETVEQITGINFFAQLKDSTGANCSTPQRLLQALEIKEIPNESFSKKFQAEYSPIHLLSEAQVLLLNGKTAEEAAAKAVLLLAVLYGKWRGMFADPTVKSVEQIAGPEIWAKKVLGKMDGWLQENSSWSEVLTDLIDEFILGQHDRIMYEKRKIDGWLHRTSGKIIKDQDYRPTWRASRFLNATRIMADLQLVEINENKEVSITEEGEALLEKLAGRQQ